MDGSGRGIYWTSYRRVSTGNRVSNTRYHRYWNHRSSDSRFDHVCGNLTYHQGRSSDQREDYSFHCDYQSCKD